MATHNDTRLNALQRELHELSDKQNAVHREMDQLRREEEEEVQRLKAKFLQKQAQLRREYDGLVRQTETVRRQIDKRSQELDAEQAKAAGKKKDVRSSFSF